MRYEVVGVNTEWIATVIGYADTEQERDRLIAIHYNNPEFMVVFGYEIPPQ